MPSLSSELCVLLTPGVVAKLKQYGVRTGWLRHAREHADTSIHSSCSIVSVAITYVATVADFVSMDVGHLTQRTGIPFKVCISSLMPASLEEESLSSAGSDHYSSLTPGPVFVSACDSCRYLGGNGLNSCSLYNWSVVDILQYIIIMAIISSLRLQLVSSHCHRF